MERNNISSETHLISVIVPIYKVEEYMDECIASIVNQTYKNLEIILVDDGSPDNCPRKCDEWAGRDGRIKVVHKKNGGLSSARNAGLDAATGDFIGFVDSDDYIASEMFQKLHDNICETESDIASCKIYYLEDNSVSEYDVRGNKIKDERETIAGMEYLRLVIGGYIENASWNKLYKRNLFERARFREGRNNEDFLFFYELLPNIRKISFVNYFGYYYRQREGSIVHDVNKFLYYDIIDNLNEIKSDISKNHKELLEDIQKKEIQERIIFLKQLIDRKKMSKHWHEAIRNFVILLKLPFSYGKNLESNFRKPFFLLKTFPFIYYFK